MVKLWFGAVWLSTATLLLLSGCSQSTADAFFAETPRESKLLHQQTRNQITAHDENMTRQHKAMSPEAAAAIDKLEADFKAKVAEIEKKAEKVHSKVGEVTQTLINRFAGMAVGEPVASLVGSAVSMEAESRSTEIAAMEADVVLAIDARLAQLSEETRLKFSNVRADRLVELEKLKGDDKAFREMLQTEAKLTNAEMDALKGYSTQELMALLLAAGGATAAGGALGKTGRSRAQPQIDSINARLGSSGSKI